MQCMMRNTLEHWRRSHVCGGLCPANVMMGKTIKGGTGAFDLLLDVDLLAKENARPQRGPPSCHSCCMWLSNVGQMSCSSTHALGPLVCWFLLYSLESIFLVDPTMQIFNIAARLLFPCSARRRRCAGGAGRPVDRPPVGAAIGGPIPPHGVRRRRLLPVHGHQQRRPVAPVHGRRPDQVPAA